MLTKAELEEFKKMADKNSLLEKVYNEIEAINGDPAKEFYKELVLTISALSKELSFLRDGKKELATLIASDDKTFERVTKLATDADKIFNGLRKGKMDIDPESAKEASEKDKEEGMSFSDKMANKKRKD